jgi:hypothetical protein
MCLAVLSSSSGLQISKFAIRGMVGLCYIAVLIREFSEDWVVEWWSGKYKINKKVKRARMNILLKYIISDMPGAQRIKMAFNMSATIQIVAELTSSIHLWHRHTKTCSPV